ncbi:hypothetical protein BB777_06745 [Planococcus faecalis]|nr:hypothetical protein BB777_06745 [Planococcus faecalis]
MWIQQKSGWQIATLSGALSVLIYMAHVIMGSVLWDGYSHVRQTISELTGNGAPDAEMLRSLPLATDCLRCFFQLLSMCYSANTKFKKLRSWELYF